MPAEVNHYISKVLTQRLEKTSGILWQQKGATTKKIPPVKNPLMRLCEEGTRVSATAD
ncbi:hypothetical protein [Chroococcidiopsis sp. CCMEE 29]|uniref:hypothetical protein n=1 Tax=Chroococcidiopsis sp. CCMEE 29 TaxID=155894 RepID=UPI00201FCFCF|nr:hypothetical protein [Chroococcidiopsis sp. CCMEE 29]